LKPVLVGLERRERISQLRSRVTNPDLQFFLALLLNVPDRSLFLDLIRQRYGCVDAAKRISGWMSELSAMGFTDVRFPAAWIAILQKLFEGIPASQMRDAFSNTAAPGERLSDSDIESLATSLSRNWMFGEVLKG
jgi:hypothetical protein